MIATQVRVAATPAGRLPRIGLGAAPAPALDEPERRLLARLRPSHLRADLHLDSAVWPEELDRVRAQAAAIGCGVEVALLSREVPAASIDLARRLAGDPPVHAALVLSEGLRPPSADWVARVRSLLGPLGEIVLLAPGTNTNFTELNRDWDLVRGAAALAYPLTPQVHAFDDRSLLETLPMQGLTVRTAKRESPGSRILVGPITLRQRFNPLAGAATVPDPESLPSSVDVRQMSLLAGAWTLGSVGSLAVAGAEACTYFEAAGWRGLLERTEGCPLPARFPSRPGMVFPAYHVLADLLETPGAEVLEVEIEANDPPRLAAVALRAGTALRLLVANLRPEPQPLAIRGLPAVSFRRRVLDAGTAVEAAFEAERFRTSGDDASFAGEVTLQPYGYLRLDAQI